MAIKDCCRQPTNLRLIEDHPHVQVRRCEVCGCRHFRALMGQTLQLGRVGIGTASAPAAAPGGGHG